MKRAAFVLLTIALAVPLFAGKHSRPQPQRLVSLSQNGANVTLHFQDGSSADVPATSVRIRRVARAKGQSHTLTVSQLSTMTTAGSLPAVATVFEGTSGRRARIRVFNSDAEAQAFVQAAADRRAAREAQKSKQ